MNGSPVSLHLAVGWLIALKALKQQGLDDGWGAASCQDRVGAGAVALLEALASLSAYESALVCKHACGAFLYRLSVSRAVACDSRQYKKPSKQLQHTFFEENQLIR